MKLLIHDMEKEKLKELLQDSTDNLTIVSEHEVIHNCIGCFGCWVKSPGTCVIHDKYEDMGEKLSKCQELIIISKCFYGGFSPFVKNVLDRSISYIHPYFTLRNGEMHHRRRYDNHIDLKVWFYGKDIIEQEKQTAIKLVRANSVNLDCSAEKVTFVEDISEIKDFLT